MENIEKVPGLSSALKALESRTNETQRSLLILTVPENTPDRPAHLYYPSIENEELLLPVPSNSVLRTDAIVYGFFFGYLRQLIGDGFVFSGIRHGAI